jgi:tRNA1(Val) A37 N6-methylase TrmN6
MGTRKKEFGDFQTSIKLSRQICHLLTQQGISPAVVVEPTCGKGSFILASLEYFPQIERVFGIEINADHIHPLRQELNHRNLSDKVEIRHCDFFDVDWKSIFVEFPDPLLIIGNPPWVTNSTLGLLNSQNLPEKTNFQNHSGLDALTGKSNFDISEWMLIHLIQLMSDRDGVLALLVKTSVARKVLKHLWEKKVEIGQSHIYLLDGRQEFGVSVDMCLFVCNTNGNFKNQTCKVYNGLSKETFLTTFGFSDGHLVANIDNYNRWKHLISTTEKHYRWRSGIKHDAAKVMELTSHTAFYKNGLGETFILENDYVYPLLKSSDVAKGIVWQPRRWVLVPQSYVGESTAHIKHNASETWNYLNDHKAFFDKRKSSIYKNKPKFSIFGVGDYSFAFWKVAISGLYKNLRFVVVGPYEDKPVMLDDTCYFISCKSKKEADFLASLLNSSIAKDFFSSFIFWDSKRPITANILSQLDILLLAEELGFESKINEFVHPEKVKQLPLFPL